MEKLKIALIGPGRMGVLYAQSIIQNDYADLIAICGNTKESTIKNAQKFDVPLYFNNNWDLMFKDHSEIDTVLISSSEWAHLKPFESSVKFQKNIILEKPITVSSSELSTMSEIYERNKNLKYFVCFTCRFDSRYIQAKSSIDNNSIGELDYIYSRRNTDYDTSLRVIKKFPLPFWIIVHDIDLMRWIFKSEVREVFSFNIGNSSSEKGIISNLFFANGKKGVIESRCFGPKISNSHTDRMDVYGSEGKIEIELSSSPVNLFSENNCSSSLYDNEIQKIHGNYVGNIPLMINNFIDTIRFNSNHQLVNFIDGYKAIRVSEAIKKSIESNKVIKVQD